MVKLCYGKSKHHKPESYPDKTITGPDIYNLVTSTHQVARLKRLMHKRKLNDSSLRNLRNMLEDDILVILKEHMTACDIFSWVEYICRKPEHAKELLTNHILRFLKTMRAIEHQYVIMRRLSDMEQRKDKEEEIFGSPSIKIVDRPTIVGFEKFPPGIYGVPCDMDLVFVYNADNYNVSHIVEKTSRWDDRENHKGYVENPELFGMQGDNIRWQGIYHS